MNRKRKKVASIMASVFCIAIFCGAGVKASAWSSVGETAEAVLAVSGNHTSSDPVAEEGSGQENNTGNSTQNRELFSFYGLMDEIQDLSETPMTDVEYEAALACYMSLYLYEHQLAYYEKYVSFLEYRKTMCEQMYALGEATISDMKECEAQIASCLAEIEVLGYEKEYCTFYLEEKKPSLGDIQIKKNRTIHDSGYYKESSPDRDAVQTARYMADFRNSCARIKAKKEEITSLEEKQKMENLLYQEGEITRLELFENEVALEKVEYELTKLYVDMNTAYYCLEH